ncbi:MAG TPA: DinB family protein [Longimicrobiaceae bacterium]|nr:DinB family protein [Longimicrobiaceae bacterium]
MESTVSTVPAPPRPAMSPKQRFLDVYERETETTLRVLRSYPDDRLDLRPAEKCKTARELAWLFVMEQGMGETAMTTGFDWSSPPPPPPPLPETVGEIADAFDAGRRRLLEVLRGTDDEALSGTVKFLVAPKTIGDVPKLDFLWFLLHDQIHHRGQFSVYLRMAGAKVPSIYGPTADEPWM